VHSCSLRNHPVTPRTPRWAGEYSVEGVVIFALVLSVSWLRRHGKTVRCEAGQGRKDDAALEY
jgi:hypothetical protein